MFLGSRGEPVCLDGIGDKSSSCSSLGDSGIFTGRRIPNRPPQRLNNISRYDQTLIRITPQLARKDELIRINDLTFKAKGRHIELSDASLLRHLRLFITPNECWPAAEDRSARLFALEGTSVAVNRSYSFPASDVRARYGVVFLKNLVRPYATLAKKIEEIDDFVVRIRSIPLLPLFWKGFVDFVHDFYAWYMEKLEVCYHSCRTSLALFWHSICDCHLSDCVELLHIIAANHLQQSNWNHFQMELAWNTFFRLCQIPEAYSTAEIEVMRLLQSHIVPVLLQVLDRIYSFGTVPSEINDHFLLFSSEDYKLGAICRLDKKDSGSLFWDEELITNVCEGSRVRCEIGALIDISKELSENIMDLLNANGFLIYSSLAKLQDAFVIATFRMTERLNKELLNTLKPQVIRYWNDAQSIVCDSVANRLASLLYSHDSEQVLTSLRRPMDICLTAQLPNANGSHEWCIRRNQLFCDMQPQFACIIPDSLTDHLRQCLNYYLVLYRCLVTIQCIAIEERQLEFTRVIRAQRRMVYVLSEVNTILSTIKDVFVSKLHNVFREYSKMFNSCAGKAELESTVGMAVNSLRHLVERKGVRGQIFNAIDVYPEVVDDIRLATLSGNLDDAALNGWTERIQETTLLLVTLGRSLPRDHMLYSVVLRIDANKVNISV